MKTRRLIPLNALAATIITAGVAACDLGPSGPGGPGVIQVTVTSPYGLEGAAVFELTGGVGLGRVSTRSGDAFYEHTETGSRIVVALDQPGELWFQVRTEDVGELPDVHVVQVADGENQLRPSVSGYKYKFVRVEDPSADRRESAP